MHLYSTQEYGKTTRIEEDDLNTCVFYFKRIGFLFVDVGSKGNREGFLGKNVWQKIGGGKEAGKRADCHSFFEQLSNATQVFQKCIAIIFNIIEIIITNLTIANMPNTCRKYKNKGKYTIKLLGREGLFNIHTA